MNIKNLKTFPGYIICTDLTGGYRIFKKEFDRYHDVMFRAADGANISDEIVAAAVLDFPAEPDEADDAIESIIPVNNLFRAWIFHHVTAERLGKIVVASKLGLLSPKDAVATDAGCIVLDPYPGDPSYTIVAETKSGKQEIVRLPCALESGD